MSDELKIINEVEELYNQPITKIGDFHVCPVCGKKAKRYATIVSHMEEQDCHDISDLLINTMHEERAFNFFKKTNEIKSLVIFRKHILYKTYLSFVLWCSMNSVEPELYLAYVCNTKNISDIKAMKYSKKPNILKDFRVYLHKNDYLIDSVAFIRKNKELLLSDPLFFTRSIETAKLSINACIDDNELNDAITTLPFDYYERIEQLFCEVTTG